jgi:hypothetical protein
MNRHRFLRAYMAGVLLPTWMLLLVLAFVVAHVVPEWLERAVVLPMAVVPNLWGLWNVLYHALRPRRLSLGAFGAFLPLILAPAGAALAAMFQPHFYAWGVALPFLPVAIAAYYLAWKYAVGFFNRVVGLD